MNSIRFAGSSALSLDSSTQFTLWDLVRESIASLTDRLQTFAQRSDFADQMGIAFGSSPAGLQQAWADGLVVMPKIEIRSQSELKGALGAFAASENTIYLSLEFLQNSDRSAVEAVAMEEYGHYLDSFINTIDSPGDEGAIFAALVKGINLSDIALSQLKAENDHTVIVVNGQAVAVEQAITQVGSYNTTGNASGVQVVGNYAYVADGNSGLQIIDISNPNAPVLAGSYDTSGAARGVQVVGNYAYVADGNSGLQIINISNPITPVLAGSYDTRGYASRVQVAGNYAYVAGGNSGLQIINISNPITPVLAGSYDTRGYASEVEVVGNYAYVADGNSGLQIIDISNPNAPVLAGSSYNTIGYAEGVQVVGNYAYVADLSSGLKIINISNPSVPVLASSYNIGFSTYGVQVVGDYAYVADRYFLQVINIGNPNAPTISELYRMSASGGQVEVQVVGNYAYVANGVGGLKILDVSDFTLSTTTISLSVSPSSVTEDGSGVLVYTFTRTGDTTNALTVEYAVGGTATFNSDYTQTGAASFSATTGTVTFDANSSTATLTITPILDTEEEPDETIDLILAEEAEYTIGTRTAVTGTIADNDDSSLPIPTVTIAATDANAAEQGTDSGIFTITLSEVATEDITVNYSISGTTTNGNDYNTLSGLVNIPRNATTATIEVIPVDDNLVEGAETIEVNLTSATGANIVTPSTATVTIADNDSSIPGDDFVLTTKDEIYEYLAKDIVYKDRWIIGEFLNFNGLNYTVDAIWEDEGTGFYSLGLTSNNPLTLSSVLAFRGTEPTADFFADIIADIYISDVGFNQFEKGLSLTSGTVSGDGITIADWVNEQNSPTLLGHSLGGALTQLFAADFTSKGSSLGDVYTFNSPGISRSRADRFDASKVQEVKHNIVSGDLVSLAGEDYIQGEWELFKQPLKEGENGLKQGIIDIISGAHHLNPIFAPEVGYDSDQDDPEKKRPENLTSSEFSSIDNLANLFFTYPTLEYFTTLLAAAGLSSIFLPAPVSASLVSTLLFRVTVETARKAIGTLVLAIGEAVDAGVDFLSNIDLNGTIQFPDIDLALINLSDLQVSLDTNEGSLIAQGEIIAGPSVDIQLPSWAGGEVITTPDLIKLNATGGFTDFGHLEGDVQIFVLGNFAQGNGEVTIDFNDRTLRTSGNLSILNDFIQGDVNLAATSNFDVKIHIPPF